MIPIYKRELHSYFHSMNGYVYAAVVLFFIGVSFRSINLIGGFPYFAFALSSTSLIFVLAAPLLTMRSIAEERRYKTDQLLLTAPVKVTAVVLGKFFAMATVYAVPLIVACLCPVVISLSGSGSFLIDYSAILAFVCLGFMMLAIGMFISSLTESQTIAAACTMGALIALFLWPELMRLIPDTKGASFIGFIVILALALVILQNLARSRIITAITGVVCLSALGALYIFKGQFMAEALGKLLEIFSVPNVINNFTNYYSFDVKGLLFFLSIAALFVFLTVQSVRKRQWS